MESLNEYHGDPLIHIYLRDHAEREGVTLPDAWPIKDNKIFQSVLEAASACWIRDELKPQDCDKGFEYWGDFKRRVFEALEQIMAANTAVAAGFCVNLRWRDRHSAAAGARIFRSAGDCNQLDGAQQFRYQVRYGGGRIS